MAKKTFKVRVWPASGGLDQSSIPGTAKINKLDECDNIIFTVNGSRKKRWGLDSYYESGFTPTINQSYRGTFDFWRNVSNVQTQKVVSFAGGKLWADSVNGVFSDVTGSTTLVADDQVTFDIYVGLMLAFFENAVPQRWNMTDSTFVDLGGSPPDASLVRVHRGRVWAAGNKAAPHRLYYSAPDSPEDWTIGGGGGSIDIDTGDSDPVGITAIFPGFHDDLYVAKRRSLYRVQELVSSDLGTRDFELKPVVQGIGCIAHNSVAATPNDIYWASERGIHSLRATDQFGDVSSTFVSWPIHELYRDDINFSRAKNMWGIYSPEKNSYLLAYTRRGRSTNFDILAYNIEMQEWYRYQDIDSASLSQFVDSRNKTRVMVGAESLNIGIFDEELVTDFGVSYDCFFTTPIIYPLGAPDVTCNYKNLWLFVKPQETGLIQMSYKIDGKTTTTVDIDQTGTGKALIGTAIIGEDIIGGSGEIKKIRVPLQGEGSGIQFTFSQTPISDDTGEDMDIYGYVIEGEFADDSAISSVA
jgi:hypothetical protein